MVGHDRGTHIRHEYKVARRVKAHLPAAELIAQLAREMQSEFRFRPSCRRSEGGDGRLQAAAAAITVFVSVYQK